MVVLVSLQTQTFFGLREGRTGLRLVAGAG
jgi:hypothetical protein